MGKKKNIIASLYEDDHLLLVNKPAPLHCIPDRFDSKVPDLHTILQRKHGNLFVTHRIDSETSGLVCFAKTAETHKGLSQAFAGRKVSKTYLAIVEGKLPQTAGKIDMPIAPSTKRKNIMRINYNMGKESLTRFEVMETFKHYSLLKMMPITGRTHQIRVHLMALGYPLAVDSVYGGKDGFYLSGIKRRYNLKKYEEEQPVMSRVSLHAHELEFEHPTTGLPVHFTADPPKDFSAVLRLLRKYDVATVL